MPSDKEPTMADAKAKEKQVMSLLSRSDHFNAIKTALADPPIQSKDSAVKDTCTAAVMKALASPSETQIPDIVEKLYALGRQGEECDTLMKYIYRGLADGVYSGNLLKWHAQVVKTAGLGAIVRTLTDRKTV